MLQSHTSRFRTFLFLLFFTSGCYYILFISNFEGHFSNLSFGSDNVINSRGNNKSTIPEVLKYNKLLMRPSGGQKDIRLDSEDRVLVQWDWILNLSRSEYMRNVKKKRILVTGLFNLDEKERQLACHQPGLNFSNYCELVEDLWNVPEFRNYDEFDAVISRRDWNNQFYEPRIPPSKINFFHIQESPYTLHQGDFRMNNPMLISYWRGSDIVTPYFKWIPHNSQNKTSSSRPTKMKNYAEGKGRLAAMVASHCPTSNDRLGFVHELQKYIPVDVYGDCGPLGKCDGNCFDMIQKNYKFYFAFENANCRDYITEKFFRNSLDLDILPVVLGAHPDDYKAASPPHSYVHVEDFDSPKELAEYLLRLDQNDTLYNEYFEWKGTGEIIHGQLDLFCRICAMLFYTDFHPPPKWSEDSYSWLQVNPCLKPNEFYWSPRKSDKS